MLVKSKIFRLLLLPSCTLFIPIAISASCEQKNKYKVWPSFKESEKYNTILPNITDPYKALKTIMNFQYDQNKNNESFTLTPELEKAINENKLRINELNESVELKKLVIDENSKLSDLKNNLTFRKLILQNMYTMYLTQYVNYKKYLVDEHYKNIFLTAESNFDIKVVQETPELKKHMGLFTDTEIPEEKYFNPERDNPILQSELNSQYYSFLLNDYLYLNTSWNPLKYLYSIDLSLNQKSVYRKFGDINADFSWLNQVVSNDKLVTETNEWKNKTFGLWKLHTVVPEFLGYREIERIEGNQSHKIGIENYIKLNIPKNQNSNTNNYWIKYDFTSRTKNDITYCEIVVAYLPNFLSFDEYVKKFENKIFSVSWLNYLIQNKTKYFDKTALMPLKIKDKIEKLLVDFNKKNSGDIVNISNWLDLYINNSFDLDFYSDNSLNNPLFTNDFNSDNSSETIIKISHLYPDVEPEIDNTTFLFNLKPININNYKSHQFFQNDSSIKHIDDIYFDLIYKYHNKPYQVKIEPKEIHPFKTKYWKNSVE
ncbi:hypothetical protein [Mycoplasma nasistruthionis]|uniref:Lipoprotein n=1 Tax=Mycoplasma nasistruthionis TaxID=353852 RepID=A0A5B7XYE8_9MOLU|nr:hypothetical protein [Mycoplasma nasistruthionis]QCZ36923.1 hypothetical protein FG904_02830 [Mycoplasma nasistruthionis]